MTTFDKREEGFEKQFAHDEELRFKANARRNKLLGLWAAELMGLKGEAASNYAVKKDVKFIWLSEHWKDYFDVVPVSAGDDAVRYTKRWGGGTIGPHFEYIWSTCAYRFHGACRE